MRSCLECKEILEGRVDKIFCSPYCKSAYHYRVNKEKEANLYVSIDRQLKTNRRLLKLYNKAGKAYVRKSTLFDEGFSPKYFTHYWRNKKGEVYLFSFEYGFLEKSDNGVPKYILVQWQDYMND